MKKQTVLTLLFSTLLTINAPAWSETIPGLWFGVVEVNKVNEVFHETATDGNTPNPVKYPFNLQLLIHTNASGVTSLLKEVFIMQTKSPGNKRRVLVTNPSRLTDFEGIIRRGDNKLVPVRLTSPSFDWDEDTASIILDGSIDNQPGSEIKTTSALILGKKNPVNPMRHQYHNEHKNFDPNDAEVGYEIKRSFVITIEGQELTGGSNNIREGSTLLSGTYKESIEGLHKQILKVAGKIQLTKVSNVKSLISLSN